MNQQPAHYGIVPHTWLQHHVPWLAMLVLVMSLFGEDADMLADPDDFNG